MAAGEAVQQSLGTIDPSSLIGRADTSIVEPRATAMLADAFRQGAVTADDIIARVGELGKTKRKAELTMAQESISPEAVAARAQGLGAATAQGALQQAQAQAALPNVDPAAALQAEQIEQQKVLIQYPAVAYFQKLAPAAGIEPPTLSDGTPDYAQMEKIGAELALHQARRTEAQQQLDNITTQESADGSVLFARTKQGEFVEPKKLQQLRSQATRPFERMGTGAVQVAPAAAVVEPLAPVNMDAARAAAAESGMPVEQAALLTEADVVPRGQVAPALVTPSPSGPAAVGTPVAGGISLGTKPGNIKGPTEAQQRAQLALARFSQAGDMQAALKEAGYDPTSIGSWMSGMLPQILKTGDRKHYEAAVDAWSQGLLRLESGAAISTQEKSWYSRSFFPQVRDPENVVLAKEAMRHDLERMVAEIAQAGGVVSAESAEQAKAIYARAGTLGNAGGGSAPAGGAAPVITLPSGRKVTRDSNGQYKYVE